MNNDEDTGVRHLVKKWNELSLIQRIVIGLIAGVLLALTAPSYAAWVTVFGRIFVDALRAVAPILVFLLVIHAVSMHQGGHATNIKTVLGLYVISTIFAGLLAVLAIRIFPITLPLEGEAAAASAPQQLSEVLQALLNKIVANPVQAISEGNYLGILTAAVVIGLAAQQMSEASKHMLGELSRVITTVIRWVINLAPLGVMGLIFQSVSTTGLGVFKEYGQLLLLLVGTMGVLGLLVNPAIAWVVGRRNPYPLLFTCLKESASVAFFTRSSAANIPVNLALCKRLNLDEDTYSLTIPLGATINMNGAAIVISIFAFAAANTLGMELSLGNMIVLSLIAALSACGASGVSGGSLLLIPLACNALNIPQEVAMQVVGVGFVVSVVQDSCETALNSSADVFFTAVAEYRRQAIGADEVAS